MSIDSRLTRLRALVDKLERLPASTSREWMLSEARARLVDVETGEAPRAMRPLAADPPPPPPEPPPRSTAGSQPPRRAVAQRAQHAKPASKTPAEPRRIEPNTSANGGAASGLPVDEAVRDDTFVARPDASTVPLDIAEVLWAEDWQADGSPAAAAGAGGAGDPPRRPGLGGWYEGPKYYNPPSRRPPRRCSVSFDAIVDWRAPSAVPTQLRTDHGLERPRRPCALATQRASGGRGARR